MKKQTFIKPGDKFGRLVAVQHTRVGKHHRRYFVFRCDCGKEIEVTAEAVISGNTKSCGCLRGEATRRRYGLLPGRAAMHQVILQYKRHAKDGNRFWHLTEDQFFEISQRNCFYCGTPPSRTKISPHGTGDFTYNGLDRMDSDMGYVIENVVACCRTCNVAKNTMTLAEFNKWARRLGAMAVQWG